MVDRTVMQSGRYKAYPEYKDSGVEWLGEIPKEWKVLPLKYILELISNGATTTQIDESPQTVPISRIETISTGEINMSKVGHINPKSISRNFKLELGDILFSHINSLPMVGNIAIKKDKKTLYHGMNLLRLRVDEVIADRSYIYWLLKSRNLRQVFEANAKPAINQASLSTNSIKGIEICIAGKKEQQQIANFLDYEAAKIDTLIEKQQRLIELLIEKRQAVISHAVTKGLNADVPMKDSGVEWLGEVPEHWDVMRFTMTNKKALLGGNYNSSESEEGIPLIKMGNLGRGSIDINKVERLSENSSYEKEHILKKGDFLFNTRNSLALVGKVSIWREELDLAIYNSNVLKIDFNHYIGTTEYMNYLFNSDLGLSQLRLIAKGTTNVAAVYYKDLKDLIFAYPPAKEQFEVVKFLNVKCEAIDSLINLAHKQIQLMQERRTALISAAVTGKIDVRDWVKPE